MANNEITITVGFILQVATIIIGVVVGLVQYIYHNRNKVTEEKIADRKEDQETQDKLNAESFKEIKEVFKDIKELQKEFEERCQKKIDDLWEKFDENSKYIKENYVLATKAKERIDIHVKTHDKMGGK